MASIIVRHGTFKTTQTIFYKHVKVQAFATKAEKKKGMDRKQPPKIEFTAQSLASKGFLRSQKDYEPTSDVHTKLNLIIENILGKADSSSKLTNLNQKFQLLSACYDEFHHSVPNSMLHTIESVDDLKKFYLTPVSTKTPFDKLKLLDLPPNLHVQADYVRWHPDTDTKFEGKTAFPRSSTLVSGLKYKDKYKGHKQAQEWPFK